MKKTALCLVIVSLLAALFVGGSLCGYRLTVHDPEGFLCEQPEKRYRAGEEVVLRTSVITDADLECFVNGMAVGKQTVAQEAGKMNRWEFSVEMPAKVVTVTFQIVDSFFGGGGSTGRR